MKLHFKSLAVAAALGLGAAAAFADELTNQDILNDEQVSQALNAGPNAPSGLNNGALAQPGGAILGTDGVRKTMPLEPRLSLDGQAKPAPFGALRSTPFAPGSPSGGSFGAPQSSFPGLNDSPGTSGLSPGSSPNPGSDRANGDFSD